MRTLWHRLRYLCGDYRRYRRLDWTKIERLVFVCKGNICRSAFAESVARGLGIEAASCGIDTILNAPANKDAINMATQFGYDLRQHKTTPLASMTLKSTDLLIAMEPKQAKFLQQHLPATQQCTLLGVWGTPVTPHIQDPYGYPAAYFAHCFSYIKDTVHELATKIR